MIEVERRSIVSKEKRDQLISEMVGMGASDLGQNDTRNVFFLTDEYQLKVGVMSSKNTAKVAYKDKRMGLSSTMTEIEYSIDVSDIDKVIVVFKETIPKYEYYDTIQKRHDYELDGVAIAVKWSEAWGYHVELDITDNEENFNHSDALLKIEKVAEKLGLKLMTQEEEFNFVENAKRVALAGKS